MQKIKVLVAGAVLFGATLFAGAAPAMASSCVTISQNLSYGSRSSEVRTLQSFLVDQNYPGGGSWMITGYYGAATQAAVKIFQQQHGITPSGDVDFSTRAALNCSTSYSNSNNYVAPTYSYPSTYVNPFNPYPYNATYPYYNGTTPMLSTLSVNTGGAGTSVTIYGNGFDYAGNTVYLGTQSLGNFSSNGTSITVVIPSYSGSGNTNLYVTNSRGTSNTLAFNVLPYFNVCQYPTLYYGSGYNNTSCGCGIYGNCNLPDSNIYAPTINYLSPATGAVGTSVTVYGSGFSSTGNTVHFGQGLITNLGSADGRSVSFIVPSQISGYGATQTTLGNYNVSVTNSSGYTTGAVPFTVTSLAGTGAPVITSISGPTSLQTGIQGTWTVAVNNANNSYLTTSISWGDQGTYGATAATPQTYYGNNTLTFTHTYSASGTYTITVTVTNSSGQSNTTTTTVNISNTASSNLTLSYLAPSMGPVGTTIQIQGNGFTAYDNTVHFGGGGSMHLPSYNNGQTITFTIPQTISGCDLQTPGMVCSMMAMLVTPGTYPVYVTNINGSTNTIYYTVQ